MKSTLLHIHNISFIRSERNILSQLSMSIADGDVVGILGANGAGKTSLLRLICGILKTDEGRVELHGKNIAELTKREIASEIAFLTQDGLGNVDFTVDEFLKFSRYARRRSFLSLEKQDFDAIENAVKITDIEEFRTRKLTQLSGGEKQRIYIAGAIAQEAKIMLLDEPTTYLDPVHWQELAEIVRKLENEGFTIVIATHSINFALRVCKRFVGLQDGKKVFDGTHADLLTDNALHQIYPNAAFEIVEKPNSNSPAFFVVPKC